MIMECNHTCNLESHILGGLILGHLYFYIIWHLWPFLHLTRVTRCTRLNNYRIFRRIGHSFSPIFIANASYKVVHLIYSSGPACLRYQYVHILFYFLEHYKQDV